MGKISRTVFHRFIPTAIMKPRYTNAFKKMFAEIPGFVFFFPVLTTVVPYCKYATFHDNFLKGQQI